MTIYVKSLLFRKQLPCAPNLGQQYKLLPLKITLSIIEERYANKIKYREPHEKSEKKEKKREKYVDKEEEV